MSSMIGRPRVTQHLEASTDDCICDRLAGCGGIESAARHCPEHGHNGAPIVKFHTHAVQVDRLAVGTRAA